MLFLAYRRHVLMLQCSNSLAFSQAYRSWARIHGNVSSKQSCSSGLATAAACGLQGCASPPNKGLLGGLAAPGLKTIGATPPSKCGGKRAFGHICVGIPNAKASRFILFGGGMPLDIR